MVKPWNTANGIISAPFRCGHRSILLWSMPRRKGKLSIAIRARPLGNFHRNNIKPNTLYTDTLFGANRKSNTQGNAFVWERSNQNLVPILKASKQVNHDTPLKLPVKTFDGLGIRVNLRLPYTLEIRRFRVPRLHARHRYDRMPWVCHPWPRVLHP